MSDVKTEPTPDRAAAEKRDQEKRAEQSKSKTPRDAKPAQNKDK